MFYQYHFWFFHYSILFIAVVLTIWGLLVIINEMFGDYVSSTQKQKSFGWRLASIETFLIYNSAETESINFPNKYSGFYGMKWMAWGNKSNRMLI